MKVIIVKDNLEGAKEGFKIVKDALDHNELNVFGLATGSTPETFYALLRESDLDFSNTVSINLDEYLGLEPTHDQSYNYFMKKQLFDAKPFKANYLPNGATDNPAEESAKYEAIIAKHPIDLQILGIGTNGHIGFNEPGAAFDSVTREVDLVEATITANSRNFDSIDDVPKTAISMGIGSILKAKKIILFAYGANKADAIYKTIEEMPTTDVPASALQNHPDVTIILDEAAASKLTK